MSKKAKSDYLIQSVSRALDLLEAFSLKEGSLGVTHLSQKLRLHKNNVFRLLATLETRGYVEQDKETERYRLSAKTFQLATVFLHHLDLRRQAHPSLETLSQKCGETVYLGLLERGSAVYVDMVESEQAVRVAPRLGRSLAAWCTATGKVLLASLPPEQRESVLRPEAPAALVDQLSSIVSEGFAIDDEECELGVRSVAAPVHDPTGRTLGAIEVSGPAVRLPVERIRIEIAPLVVASAQEVEARLGSGPPTS